MPKKGAPVQATANNSPLGSLWNRWDLHFHTPSSFDYQHKGATNEDLVESLKAAGVRAVVVTDHHVMDVARVREMQRLGGDCLTVLPGIELRGDLGGKETVHFIGIFPEDCDLEYVWGNLSVRLKLTDADVKRIGHENVYCDLKDSADVIHELGGIVSIHGHGKANSIEGIANYPAFKAQLKKDLLRDYVDLLEVGKAERQEDYTRIVFPAVGCELPLILCSDNHDCRGYTSHCPCWLRCDPTFLGLLMVLREPLDRTFIGSNPEQHLRVEQAKKKYIKSIAFGPSNNPNRHGGWFSGQVSFNPGLVAIIGNKGSGKSALADALGLLGSTKNVSSFSFLNAERFRHPISGRAGDFQGTLTWWSGDTVTKNLSEDASVVEVEAVKYLPQSHIEKVCNEIIGVNEGIFERELKAVIFSHVPVEERLEQVTLDELIEFRTSEKQRHIDSLLRDLRELSRRRGRVEVEMHPAKKQELQNQLAARQKDLSLLDSAKPAIKGSADASAVDPVLLKELSTHEVRLKELQQAKEGAQDELRRYERRVAVADIILEKLGNFESEFGYFLSSLEESARELDLNPKDLVKFTVDRTKVSVSRKEASAAILKVRAAIDSEEPAGLIQQIEIASATVATVRAKLDEPTRLYQESIVQLEEWQRKRDLITGAHSDPDSIIGLESRIKAFETYPNEVARLQQSQLNIAVEIHKQKLDQAAVLQRLYGPVQDFISNHEVARGKLKLDFRVEITDTGFGARLLDMLSLNRKGSFMGIDEGRARADSLSKATDWNVPSAVETFLKDVDAALHTDLRTGNPAYVADQMATGRQPEDVYNMLYGLEYLRSRYMLSWEGKDLTMLSPGERGTLLLTFYLLIDQSDVPLIIDQPEGNLDNHTVARVLVDCIRLARSRRQVFIVTHNPNLAVVCDADQIVHARLDKDADNRVTYTTGSLENPETNALVTDVLEGTRWAFDVRGDKYDVVL